MRLLTFAELRKLKNISKPMGYRLVKEGMPHYRIKRNIYVDPDEFDEWFEKFKIQGQSRKTTETELNHIIQSSLAELGIH